MEGHCTIPFAFRLDWHCCLVNARWVQTKREVPAGGLPSQPRVRAKRQSLPLAHLRTLPCAAVALLHPVADVTWLCPRAVWPDLPDGPLWGHLTALAWLPAEEGLYTLPPSPAHLSSATALRCVDMLPFLRCSPQQPTWCRGGRAWWEGPIRSQRHDDLERAAHRRVLPVNVGPCT